VEQPGSSLSTPRAGKWWCGGLCLVLPEVSLASAPARSNGIVQKFLGEELTYQIGFWLFNRCGEAKTTFVQTEYQGVYRATLAGRTLGFVDVVLGRYRYSYASYLELSPKGDRLRPLRFTLTKKRIGKESKYSVTFNYSKKQLIFSRVTHNQESHSHQETQPMKEGLIYEDYLTLFYNFRYGCYGPIQRGRTYHLPLHVHKGMSSIDLSIASREEEEKHRKEERVNREDVSSNSGDIEGWLSSDATPVKGTIKDVILFGDLWGELIARKAGAHRKIGRKI